MYVYIYIYTYTCMIAMYNIEAKSEAWPAYKLRKFARLLMPNHPRLYYVWPVSERRPLVTRYAL